MAKYAAILRVSPGSAGGAEPQWLSEDNETLEELKKRMRAAGSNPSLYNFTTV